MQIGKKAHVFNNEADQMLEWNTERDNTSSLDIFRSKLNISLEDMSKLNTSYLAHCRNNWIKLWGLWYTDDLLVPSGFKIYGEASVAFR